MVTALKPSEVAEEGGGGGAAVYELETVVTESAQQGKNEQGKGETILFNERGKGRRGVGEPTN